MKQHNLSQSQDNEILPFQPFDQYRPPSMPTDESLRRAGWKLWRWWRNETEADPFIADDSLNRADQTQLDHLAAPPACGPLLEELNLTFENWIPNSSASRRVQLVVLPPCDRNDIVKTWAEINGYPTLDPPDRETLLTNGKSEIQLDRGEEGEDRLLVIPRLERWFLRHYNGLNTIQRLFENLESSKQRVVIGCGSWSRAYLSKAIQTDLVLPTGLTFQPFDGGRLLNWFSALADDDESRDSQFRFSDSGKTIFDQKPSKNGVKDYFATLAATSRGIPWVAWHLWRQSLRLGPNEDAKVDQKFSNERTIWVSKLKKYTIPNDEVAAALLILQSLLIHDRLTATELAVTVPGVQRSNVLSALLDAGIVRRDDKSFCCEPAAYPAIREQLVNAGFPNDQF